MYVKPLTAKSRVGDVVKHLNNYWIVIRRSEVCEDEKKNIPDFIGYTCKNIQTGRLRVINFQIYTRTGEERQYNKLIEYDLDFDKAK